LQTIAFAWFDHSALLGMFMFFAVPARHAVPRLYEAGVQTTALFAAVHIVLAGPGRCYSSTVQTYDPLQASNNLAAAKFRKLLVNYAYGWPTVTKKR